MKQRLDEFKKILESNQIMTEFDRAVFESIVEKVIVGGIDENGDKDSAMLNIIYKTGRSDKQNSLEFKSRRKNACDNETSKELCFNADNMVGKLCSNDSFDTR